jgi:hypothetical protein
MDTQTQNGKCHLHLLDYEFTFASRQYFLGNEVAKNQGSGEISRQTHANAAFCGSLAQYHGVDPGRSSATSTSQKDLVD